MPRKNSRKSRTSTTVVDGQRVTKVAPKKKRVTRTKLADGTKVKTVDNSKKIKRTETRTTRAQSKVDGTTASNNTRTAGGLKAKNTGKISRNKTKAQKLADKKKRLVGTKPAPAYGGNFFRGGKPGGM